jgi:uncharacterized protein (TIGR04222 family)
MTTSAPASAVTPEELGFLVSGPGRATEAAMARLLDADLIRISRQALVSAVNRPGNGATPLEQQILTSVRAYPQNIDVVAKSTAHSPAVEGLRQHLLQRGLMQKRRSGCFLPLVFIVAFGTFMAGAFSDNFGVYLVVAGAVAVLGTILLGPRGPLTSAGKRVLRDTPAADRVMAVARYGLRGRIMNQPVADMFGLTASIVGMLPVRGTKKQSSSSDSGGCGSGCGSSCGSSCGGSSCSSSSSSCSSSSSSCSSSSSSSCSSSSSSSCSSSSS